MTTIHFAHVDGAQGDCVLKGVKGVKRLEAESAPSLLVSYYYLEPFLKEQSKYMYRDWVMDSGAFSAYNSGKVIDLDAYIEKCLELMETDPTLKEIYALDVIGDDRASLKNCEKMWKAGVPAIPTYHFNEPTDALIYIAKEYPKIALGGMKKFRGKIKLDWAGQCFARVWPKKIHGFACSAEEVLMALPFHSVDATSWEISPCGFGRWRSFGTMSVRGSKQNLRAEVEWYLKLERKVRIRWEKEMALLEEIEPGGGVNPTVHLAVNPNARAKGNLTKKITKKKTRRK